jgi:hypothetical protein
MIISSTLLKNSLDTYNKNKKVRENYGLVDAITNTFSVFVDTIVLIISILFFILELLVMIYAVVIAINCTSSGPERITHLVLAVTFTLPYMLLNSLFNKCAIASLKGSKGILPYPLNALEKSKEHFRTKDVEMVTMCY